MAGWSLVGDVAGRGAEAAALTSLSRYTLRAVGKLLGDPMVALEQLNAALRERPELPLVSVCCALLRESGAEAEVDARARGSPARIPDSQTATVSRSVYSRRFSGPTTTRSFRRPRSASHPATSSSSTPTA